MKDVRYMPVRFRRKGRKMRGYDRGFGEKKKHRGKGSHGGRGYAGSTKHKKSYIVRFEPKHFDHRGFHPLQRTVDKIANVGGLEKLAKGGEVNLTELGYDKLLAKGEVTKPVTVHVSKFSKGAKAKIEKAGGKIVEE